MRVDVITLFPEMFVPFVNSGVMRIAREKGLVEVVLVNLRDFAADRRGTVDDRPFGGGPGMVLKPEPLVRAVESVVGPAQPKAPAGRESELILLTPDGEPLSQGLVRTLAEKPRLTLLAGHYEGSATTS
jgi:tRNA (guanine37-N1)-methyltransferase